MGGFRGMVEEPGPRPTSAEWARNALGLPRGGRCDDLVNDALASLFLSSGLGRRLFGARSSQRLAWPAKFASAGHGWRMAARHFARIGRAVMRVFLGNVELFFLSQMGLSHAWNQLAPCFRNAPAWIPRLHSVFLGTFCARQFPL